MTRATDSKGIQVTLTPAQVASFYHLTYTSAVTVDQHLCFRHVYSSIPVLHKSEISRFEPASVAVQVGLSRTWSETKIVCFLMLRIINI